MIAYDAKRWFSLLFRVKGSVLPGLLPRIAITSLIGAFAQILFRTTGFRVPAIGHTLIGVALGLLLVFRTNASYDRFWEGRRLVGAITNRSRDLMRQVVSLFSGTDPRTRAEQADVQRLIVAFYRVMVQGLRDERDLTALGALLSESERGALDSVRARPGVVATWISKRIVAEAERTELAETRLLAIDANLTALIDSWGACERILRTPVPFAYAQHIKLFVTVWCFSVPFAMVDALRWYTPVAAALLAFALFGIDEIGVEIEDPFGYDANDLPLDAIGDGIEASSREILAAGQR